MPLRIVTDSTADLDPGIRALSSVGVVPLTVYFGDEALLDQVEITPEQFYRRLSTEKVLPRTSQPSVGAFQQVYAELAAAGAKQILSVHISSKLSGTCNAARLAAQEPPPGCHIEVLDSLTVAGALGHVVGAAVAVAESGGDVQQALHAAEDAMSRQTISILLDTLEYLQRGGRIGRARAFLGSVLNIKPIVRVEGGEVVPGERVRSRLRGIERIFEATVAQTNLERVTVQHSGCSEDAGRLAARLRAALPAAVVESCWIGPVVGVYVGPNGLGTASLRRPTAP